MDDRFEVTVGAGTMMSASGSAVRFPHRWTPGGVTVDAGFTGGHLLHLAVAGTGQPLSASAGWRRIGPNSAPRR